MPLDKLIQAHLLAEPPRAVHLPDLLRAYATEQALAHDSRDTRDAAVHRVLDHYLHTARHAAMLMEPLFDPVTLSPPQPGVILGQPATAREAAAWFSAGRAGLLAAVRLAGQAGFDTHAWQLAWTLSTFFLRSGAWEDHALAQHAGLEAARRTHDVAGEAHALHGLALGYARSGRFADAYPCFNDALTLFAGAETRSARRESIAA